VLHQRLRDEQHLHGDWARFYRYARQLWPDRLRPWLPRTGENVQRFRHCGIDIGARQVVGRGRLGWRPR
jgi:hypothetical protein